MQATALQSFCNFSSYRLQLYNFFGLQSMQATALQSFFIYSQCRLQLYQAHMSLNFSFCKIRTAFEGFCVGALLMLLVIYMLLNALE